MNTTYKNFRKTVLRMTLADLGALLGCGPGTLSRFEKGEQHHPSTKALYLFLEKDPVWCIKTLVINATEKGRVVTKEQFVLLKNVARSSLSRDEYPTWEELMYKRHPELSPETP